MIAQIEKNEETLDDNHLPYDLETIESNRIPKGVKDQ